MPRSGKRSQRNALFPVKRAAELSVGQSGICGGSQLEFIGNPDGTLMIRSLQSAEGCPGAWARRSHCVLFGWNDWLAVFSWARWERKKRQEGRWDIQGARTPHEHR